LQTFAFHTISKTIDRRRSQVEQNVLRPAIVCHYTKTKLYGDSIQNQLHKRAAAKISGKEVDLLDKGWIKLSPQIAVFESQDTFKNQMCSVSLILD